MIISDIELQNKLHNQEIKKIKIQKYFYQNILESNANVLFFLINNTWFSLTIDCGIIFFNEIKNESETHSWCEGEYKYEIEDIEIKKPLRIILIKWEIINESIIIKFDNGYKINYKNTENESSFSLE